MVVEAFQTPTSEIETGRQTAYVWLAFKDTTTYSTLREFPCR